MYALLSEMNCALLLGGYVELKQILPNGVRLLRKQTGNMTKYIVLCDCMENKVMCQEDLLMFQTKIEEMDLEDADIMYLVYGFSFRSKACKNTVFINADTGNYNLRLKGKTFAEEGRTICEYAEKERKKVRAYRNMEYSSSDICMVILMAVNVWMYFRYKTLFNNSYGLTSGSGSDGEYYRYITYMFLHGNLFHLISNMISLWILGKRIITVAGQRFFLLVYFVGGIGGAIISTAWKQYMELDVCTVGASGAIFALLGATVAIAIADKDANMDVKNTLRYAVTVFLLSWGKNTDIACHLGGMLAGFELSFFLIAAKKNRQYEDILEYSNARIGIHKKRRARY